MGSKGKNIIMNLAAISSVILGVLFLVAILIIVVLTTATVGLNMAKVFIADFILLIIGLILFLICLGLYEFFKSFAQIEVNIEKLEGEVESFESQSKNKKTNIVSNPNREDDKKTDHDDQDHKTGEQI